MMKRRKFLSLFGLGTAGTAVGGVSVVASMPPEISSDPELSPGETGSGHLVFHRIENVKHESPITPGEAIFGYTEYKQFESVSLAVGKDGCLWLKNHNNEWKRIVTE